MSDQNQPEPKIKWLSDFYRWRKVLPDDKNFLDENDFTTINGNIQLVKIDPKFTRDSLWISDNIDMFLGDSGEGFSLYQVDSPSMIRQNIPVRFFYSKRYGKVFELNGTNRPIYDMFSFILGNTRIKEDILGNVSDWFSPAENTNVENYIRMFFDNVKGRHGRFELVDAYPDSNKTGYDLLNDRVQKFHQRLNTDMSTIDRTQNYNYHAELKRVMKGYVNGKITLDVKAAAWKGCPMLFRDSLFISDVSVSTEGIVSQTNEHEYKPEVSLYPLNESEQKKLAKEA